MSMESGSDIAFFNVRKRVHYVFYFCTPPLDKAHSDEKCPKNKKKQV